VNSFQSSVPISNFMVIRDISYYLFKFSIKTTYVQAGLEEAKNFRDRNIFIILVPNKAAVQKTQEPPKKKDKSAKDEVSASVQA